MEGVVRKTIVALSHNFPGEIEENHEKSQSV
jgi:hypothetical protein